MVGILNYLHSVSIEEDKVYNYAMAPRLAVLFAVPVLPIAKGQNQAHVSQDIYGQVQRMLSKQLIKSLLAHIKIAQKCITAIMGLVIVKLGVANVLATLRIRNGHLLVIMKKYEKKQHIFITIYIADD